jgi:hypothetical protein
MMIPCLTCGQEFEPLAQRHIYCSPYCRRNRTPGVYRFICLDGRSYVGSTGDVYTRARGIDRRSTWLKAAFEQYPPKTWTFEVLELLPLGCSDQELREAEQRHIERLRSWDPEYGFNDAPAAWDADGPGAEAARRRANERLSRQIKEARARWDREQALRGRGAAS